MNFTIDRTCQRAAFLLGTALMLGTGLVTSEVLNVSATEAVDPAVAAQPTDPAASQPAAESGNDTTGGSQCDGTASRSECCHATGGSEHNSRPKYNDRYNDHNKAGYVEEADGRADRAAEKRY